MPVFQAFLKISKRNLISSSIIAFAIFILLSVNAYTYTPKVATEYTEVKIDLGIIDRDNTTLSKMLYTYLSERFNVIDVSDNEKNILDDIYYCKVTYVLTIEKGYENKIKRGETDNLFTHYTSPGSTYENVVNSAIDEYVKTLNVYMASGTDIDTAIENTNNTLANDVDVKMETFTTEDTTANTKGTYYFTFLGYSLIAMILSVLSPLLKIINEPSIRKRALCSATSSSSYTLQVISGSGLILTLIWTIVVVVAVTAFKIKFNTTGLLMMLNSFILLIIGCIITILLSSFNISLQVLSVIMNILPLGLAFLGGVFVDQDLLSGTMLKIGSFVPTFWYVKATNILTSNCGEVYSLTGYWKCIGIEMLFAAVLFILTMVISKKQASRV